MRRLALVVAVAAFSFVIGWLSSNPSPAAAAPVHRWTAGDEAYYADLIAAHTALDDALRTFFDAAQAGDEAPEAVEAGAAAVQTLRNLEPTTPMLAVDVLADHAAGYCGNIIESFGDAPPDELFSPLFMGIVFSMRDTCAVALRDVKVEVARFAAANGGFPELDDRPTPVATGTPAPTGTP